MAHSRDVLVVILDHSIDVCILLDAGVKVDQVASKSSTIKAGLGPGFGVFIFPTVHVHFGTNVGGAIVIMHNRIEERKINQLAPLGTLVEFKGKLGNQRFGVYGIYSAVTQESSANNVMPPPAQTTPSEGVGRTQWIKPSRLPKPRKSVPNNARLGSLQSKVKSLLSPDDGSVHEHLRGVLLDGLAQCVVEGRT